LLHRFAGLLAFAACLSAPLSFAGALVPQFIQLLFPLTVVLLLYLFPVSTQVYASSKALSIPISLILVFIFILFFRLIAAFVCSQLGFTSVKLTYSVLFKDIAYYLLCGFSMLIGYALSSSSLYYKRLSLNLILSSATVSFIVGLYQILSGYSRPSGLAAEPRFFAALIIVYSFCIVYSKVLRSSRLISLLFCVPLFFLLWRASSTYVLISVPLLILAYSELFNFPDLLFRSLFSLRISPAFCVFLCLFCLIFLYFTLSGFSIYQLLNIRANYQYLFHDLGTALQNFSNFLDIMLSRSSFLDDQIKLPLLISLNYPIITLLGTGFPFVLTSFFPLFSDSAAWMTDGITIRGSFNFLQYLLDLGFPVTIFLTFFVVIVLRRNVALYRSILYCSTSHHALLHLFFTSFFVLGFFIYGSSSFPFYIAAGWCLHNFRSSTSVPSILV